MMSKVYEIEDGNVFKGTLEQFRKEGFFIGPCEHEDVVEWCHDQDYQFTVTDAPEDNTHDLKIAGYANKTAMHPVGSYIGFEPGPTVFAQPLVYLSEAQEAIDQQQEQSVRQMFKDVVDEAQRPFDQRGDILHGCAIPSDWFSNGKRKGTKRYDHLTDEYIDSLPFARCRQELALFIANCYRQR